MGAFFAFFTKAWGFVKSVPSYFSMAVQALKAIAAIKDWIKDLNSRASEKKQDELVEELKQVAEDAIENKDQRPLEEKLSGEEGGLPATIRDGVQEMDSDDRIERQKGRV